MALSRVKVWISGEVLTASDLNSEFNNILDNASSLFSPLDGTLDLDGNTLILDAAGGTTIVSSTDTAFALGVGSKSGTPGTTGSILDIGNHTFTDSATAGSGTATAYIANYIRRPTLAASNSSVTTTDAATLYIRNSPLAGSNETLTNAWALWIDDGAVRFDASNSKASAASATLRSFYLSAQTQTVTGSTNITTAAGFNFSEIGQPTYSAASALTVTHAATLYIANAPAGSGAGPCTITNPYAFWIDDGAARFDGAIDESIATVASHATTAPIWAAAGNVVDYTGTATATAFPASYKAGMRRTLICAGAAAFTAGANMLIDGIGSGATITAAAGDKVHVTAVTTTQFRLTIDRYDGTPIVPNAGVAGDARNLKATLTSAGATITYTADEIIVGTALGGTVQKLASYSQALNTSTTGAGGMDTGALPTSGFISIYAIAKADGTKNILGCAVATSTATIYAGGNMPSGYTFSALMGIWPTNGTPNLIIGFQLDRELRYVEQNIFTATTGQTSYTSQSLSVAVPAAAKWAVGNFGGITDNRLGAIASDANGTGAQYGNAGFGAVAMDTYTGVFPWRVPLITANTIFWKTSETTANNFRLGVVGYSI